MKLRHIFFIFLFFLLITYLIGTLAPRVYAGEVDRLVDRLVQKGVLSANEAEFIKEDHDLESTSEEKNVSQRPLLEDLPDWVKTMRLQGDLRLRYQDERRENYLSSNEVSRTEGKARFRLGIESAVSETVKIGAGIRTGSADPRSANTDLSSSFSNGDIRLDHAYAEYRPQEWFAVIGGKFPKDDYLWHPTDMLWDNDIRPEGISIALNKTLGSRTAALVNVGIWHLNEISSSKNDPYLAYVQPGLKFEGDHLDARVGGVYYWIQNVDDGPRLANSACTNTGLTIVGSSCIGTLQEEYNSFGFQAEIGFRLSAREDAKRFGVFGEYLRNREFKTEEQAWAWGAKIGDQAIKGFADWEALYQYTHLERDAFLDVFPDSSRYLGQTDVEGHKISFKFGLAQNIYLQAAYYNTTKIRSFNNDGEELPEKILEVDLNFRF